MGERVLVTGAGGFVGRHVVTALLGGGHEVAALVGRRTLPAKKGLTVFTGRLESPELDRAARSCTAAIHLVGIIFEKRSAGQTFEQVHIEGTRRVLEVCRAAGVGRYVHMSALGARPGAGSRYHQSKWAAEELVRSQKIPYTIFRPSLIHGRGGEFTEMQVAWARGSKVPWLFMPYFARGLLGRGKSGLLQPVAVADVARAFAESLEVGPAERNEYDLVGEHVLGWPELHRAVAIAVRGSAKTTLGIPVWYAKLLTSVVPGALLPFNADQVVMSQEDNTGDSAKFAKDFGWLPAGFVRAVADRAVADYDRP